MEEEEAAEEEEGYIKRYIFTTRGSRKTCVEIH